MSSRLNSSNLILAALQLAEGQPTRGARFAQLLRQVDPSFAPAHYGEPTLRSLLERHPNVVRLERDNGVDILVVPVARDLGRDFAGAARLRRDFWAAFTLVNDRLLRFYDRATDSVVTFTQWPQENEPPEVKARRESVAADRSRFVSIAPISSEEQLVFARQFAAQQRDADRELLESALSQQLWFREFQAALRPRTDLAASWRAARSEFVRMKIEQWVASNRLDITNLFEGSRTNTAVRYAGGGTPATAVRDQSIRSQILAALTRAPTSFLLTIPIPAEYWIESE